jgi:hypothetical protein
MAALRLQALAEAARESLVEQQAEAAGFGAAPQLLKYGRGPIIQGF